LWTSWFIALIALTSVFYFVEEFGLRGTPFPGPEALEQRRSTLPDGFDGAELDLAVYRARQVLPDLRIRRILFPGNRNRPIAIQGDNTAWLVRPRANTVYIDPVSLQVVGSYTGEELDFYTRISEAADPLHFGYFGGIWTQALWFVLGVLMSGLSITGILIYAKRIQGKTAGKKPIPEARTSTGRELSQGSAI
jgi:uncharacterized iron-regulated membrane protein